jgi:hypothetical protein
MWCSISRGKNAPIGPISYSNTMQLRGAVEERMHVINLICGTAGGANLFVSCLAYSKERALKPAGGNLIVCVRGAEAIGQRRGVGVFNRTQEIEGGQQRFQCAPCNIWVT